MPSLTTLYLCISLFLFSSFQITEDPASEIIRRKIENSSDKPIVCFETSVYCDTAINSFYRNRAFQLVWSQTMESQLLKLIQSAVHDGLQPSDYHMNELLSFQQISTLSESEKADRDLLLSDAFLLYTSHMLSGKINPTSLNADWHIARREGDPISHLEKSIELGHLDSLYCAIAPNHFEYEMLKHALATYRSMEGGEWESIPNGETIKMDMDDDRIPAIRERLIRLGDYETSTDTLDNRMDEKLVLAVKQFQSRHNLEQDGHIGNQTIMALNVTPEQRILQIRANMERWRWLPQEFGDYYAKVNIARYQLDVVENGDSIRTHKIIVGKPFRSTPIFASKIEYIVFNPTWTIPPGILQADVLPGVRKDVSYLKKKNIAVLDGNNNPIDPASLDWNSPEVKQYTYRQPPGPDNALGVVKFMFPNNFLVYMHDTPSKGLFSKNERAFSSGCIRVQEPLKLAKYFLNDDELWNSETIDELITTKKTTTVTLKKQPNVYLLYFTTWLNKQDMVHFSSDIYQRDQPLIDALNQLSPKLIN